MPQSKWLIVGALLWLSSTSCNVLFGVDSLAFDGTAGAAPTAAGGGMGGAGAGGATAASGGRRGTISTGDGSGGSGGQQGDITPRDCLDVHEALPLVPSAVYEIDPDGDGGDEPLKVYCDMDTDGGGWTLVYAYTFTNYDSFKNDSNAVTPWPSWSSLGGTGVPISYTTPLALDDYGAMPFASWKQLGDAFLVRSNLTHWVSCEPDVGSLVDMVAGAVSCTVVSNVASVCLDNAPTSFQPHISGSCSPSLDAGNHYFCWDGQTGTRWPTHDACGTNNASHVTGLSDPRGAIFIRRSSGSA